MTYPLSNGSFICDVCSFNSEGTQLRALVDGEDSCTAPLALDLAACAAGCCFTGHNDLMADRFSALLTGYHKQRPMSTAERAFIPHFMWAATLSCGYYRFVEVSQLRYSR